MGTQYIKNVENFKIGSKTSQILKKGLRFAQKWTKIGPKMATKPQKSKTFQNSSIFSEMPVKLATCFKEFDHPVSFKT